MARWARCAASRRRRRRASHRLAPPRGTARSCATTSAGASARPAARRSLPVRALIFASIVHATPWSSATRVPIGGQPRCRQVVDSASRPSPGGQAARGYRLLMRTALSPRPAVSCHPEVGRSALGGVQFASVESSPMSPAAGPPPRRVLVSCGEPSGDLYAGELVRHLRERGGPIDIFGLGGDRLLSQDARLLAHVNELAVVGLVEVVRHLRRLRAVFRAVLAEVDRQPVALAVLVDYAGFNLRLAKQLRRRGIPVVYYVSPQLWAWRRGRMRTVRECVERMLVIFPFEEPFYRAAGVNATFVGHPLVELCRPAADPRAFLTAQGLDPDRPVLAVLPGSRRQEIAYNLPPIAGRSAPAPRATTRASARDRGGARTGRVVLRRGPSGPARHAHTRPGARAHGRGQRRHRRLGHRHRRGGPARPGRASWSIASRP